MYSNDAGEGLLFPVDGFRWLCSPFLCHPYVFAMLEQKVTQESIQKITGYFYD